ncbi:MAG: hypothetical protein WCO30_02505 [bacterium]
MEIKYQTLLLVFCFLSLFGFYFAYLYGKKTRKFRWSEYFAMLSVPLLSLLGLVYFFGIKIVWLFILSAVAGFIFEYGVGFFYHKTLNKRLWVYNVSKLNGYTSWLTLPMWGIGGVLFYLVSKTIGL